MLTLSVAANGPGKSSFTYRWKRRGSTPFSSTATGKNSKNLKISSVTSSDSGSYYCTVMNQWGNMMNSDEATVNVLCKFIHIPLSMKQRKSTRYSYRLLN